MSNPIDYRVSQKVVHWLMSFLIILDLFVADKFGGVMEEWDRLESRSDHATLGTIVLTLFLIRIYLRIRHGAPPLPAGMTAWQVKAAHWGHWLLYGLIGLLILSGLATAINATAPIALFQSVEITIGAVDDSTFKALRPIHEFATNAIIALIVVHIVAALYHHIIMRDDSLVRMLKFWKQDKGGTTT